MSFFWNGVLVGFLLAFPVGPIGLMCIRHTLKTGWRGSLMVGIGAASADYLYSAIASLFFQTFLMIFLSYHRLFQFLGGVIMSVIALREYALSQNVVFPTPHYQMKASYRVIGEVFVLTLSNPMTVLGFIGIFSSLQISPSTIIQYIELWNGVFLGSFIWWAMLGSFVVYARKKLSSRVIQMFCKVSSICLGLIGLILSLQSLLYTDVPFHSV